MIGNHFKFVVAPAVVAVLALPLAAHAQTPSYASHGETISGTIASVQSANHIFLADDRGFTDDVTFRSGAAVYSNGARLAPGEHVTIAGSNGGSTFLASRVTADAGSAPSADSYAAGGAADAAPVYVPTPVYEPVYYGYPYYGYPYYGYSPYGYGYGLSIGLGIGGYRGYGGGYHGYGGYRGGGYGGYHGGGAAHGGGGFHGGGGAHH